MTDDTAPGNDARSLARDHVSKLYYELAKFPGVATKNDHYLALSYTVRDRLLHRWVSSARGYLEQKRRTPAGIGREEWQNYQQEAREVIRVRPQQHDEQIQRQVQRIDGASA